MPKLHPHDLFNLIKSLSKSEKRYFKLHASRHVIGDENSYEKLFDAIEAQEVYNEKEILSTQTYIAQLPQLKNRLHEMILKSLDVFHAADTVETRLKNNIHHIRILIGKRLFSQAENILSKLKVLAREQEQFLVLIELIALKAQLFASVNYAGRNEKDLIALQQEEEEVLKKISNTAAYRLLTQQMFMNIRKYGQLMNPVMQERYKKIMKNPLLSSVNKAETYRSRYYYYLLHSTYSWLLCDYQRSYDIITMQIKMMESYPLIVEESPKQYIDILFNRIISQLHLKKFLDFKPTLEKLRNIKLHSVQLDFFRSQQSLVYELIFYNETGQFDYSLETLKRLERFLHQHKKTVDDVATDNAAIFYEISSMYFALGDYKNALKWLNKILNDNEKNRSDIYEFSRLFSLVIHYELGNDDLLQYAIVSTKKFLYKRKRLRKMEKYFFDFIQKNYRGIDDVKLKKSLAVLRAQLLSVKEDGEETPSFGYFDFIAWIDAKLKKRKYADIIKENAKVFF